MWGQEDRERNEYQSKKRIAELYDQELPSIQDKVPEDSRRLIDQ